MAFKDGNGDNAAQGMLRWRLHDKCGTVIQSRPCLQCLAHTAASASVAVADCRLANRQLLVATFHLKAKPGAVNDAIRHSQVSTQCAFCTACSVAAGTDASPDDRSRHGHLVTHASRVRQGHDLYRCPSNLQCCYHLQAQQAVTALAAEREAVTGAQCSGGGNGCGPGPAADARGTDASASSLDSKHSSNGSHPPAQPSGGSLPVLLCGDMNAEPESSACEVCSSRACCAQLLQACMSCSHETDTCLLCNGRWISGTQCGCKLLVKTVNVQVKAEACVCRHCGRMLLD